MSKPSGPSPTSRRRWTVVEARTVLSALASSGLTPSAFAKREGLDPQRVRAWQRKLGAAVTSTTAFIEVRARVAERIEVVLRSGLVVRVVDSVDTTALRRLVDALDRPC